MAITTEMLEGMGIDKENIGKIMAERGKELNPLKEKVSKLENEAKESKENADKLAEQLKEAVSKSGNAEDLQKKIEAYEQAEKDRKQAEKDAEMDRILTENIVSAMTGKEFVNEMTKQAVISQVKAELSKSENKGRGAREVFEALTKDSQDIFKNPQHEKLELPGTGDRAEEKEKPQFKSFF